MLVPITPELSQLKFRGMTKTDLIDKFSDARRDYEKKTISRSLFHVEYNLPGDGAHHKGYFSYLDACWASHEIPCVSPDVVHQLLLSDLCTVIAEAPEKHRHLFSRSEEKQTIVVEYTPPSVLLPVDKILDKLVELCPTNISKFLPTFTSTTPQTRLTTGSLFCQAVSPYYDYWMKACGFRGLKVLGTHQDWAELARTWLDITSLFPDSLEWLQNVNVTLARLVLSFNEPVFWADMFRSESCGSGSDTEIDGWLSRLARKQPSLRKSENFPSGIGRVFYKDISTQQNYELITGVLSSSENAEGVREFQHGYVVFNKKNVPVTESWDLHARTVLCAAS